MTTLRNRLRVELANRLRTDDRIPSARLPVARRHPEATDSELDALTSSGETISSCAGQCSLPLRSRTLGHRNLQGSDCRQQHTYAVERIGKPVKAYVGRQFRSNPEGHCP